MRRFCRAVEPPRSRHDVLGAWGASQKKGKGKAKAGNGGAGGGPSTKAAAAAGSSGQGSSGQGSSGQGSSRPSAPPARIIGLSTAEEPAVQIAEAPTGAQQTEPQPQPAGSTKKDKERQRKERQRQRKIEEAMEALDAAMALMARTADARRRWRRRVQAAAKHDGRSEPLAALVAEARGMLEQARAAEAERVRVAAEAAAAAVAVDAVAEAAEAVKRLQLEERRAALALELQQVQAELGSGSGTPQLQPDEESQCVLCLDAPNDHIITPCGHQ
jgi:hypothetical protein